MTEYYLQGTTTGLSATEAKAMASGKTAIARPQDRADWYVVFLTANPIQHGQAPFELTREELASLTASQA